MAYKIAKNLQLPILKYKNKEISQGSENIFFTENVFAFRCKTVVKRHVRMINFILESLTIYVAIL